MNNPENASAASAAGTPPTGGSHRHDQMPVGDPNDTTLHQLEESSEEDVYSTRPEVSGIWRLFVYSAIGIFVFFVSINIGGKSTIPLDHMVTAIRTYAGPVVPWILFALILYGTGSALWQRKWMKSPIDAVFTAFKIIGLVVSVLILMDRLPSFLSEPDLVPFLWEKIVIPVGLIVPIGSAFLALLVGFGLMEYVGVWMQPIMRPVWKTPGRSAIDAVASFVGSYSLGLIITDRVYKSGRYTGKEAAIIATGFSTVSAAFMVIVANTLDLMSHWTMYFVVTFIVTFIVTAITVRIPPLSTIPDDYYPGSTPQPELQVTGKRSTAAWNSALHALKGADSLPKTIWDNFLDGLKMSSAIAPSILSVGLTGLLLAKHTPIFDWLGYIFYPFAWIVRLPEPLLAGKASAMGLAEMLLPATAVADQESIILRFVVAVVAVSAVIFFSGMIPCVMATEIPISIAQMVVVWFIRVALTIVITTPIAYLLL